jgi:SAM-dependent methyltransferase
MGFDFQAAYDQLNAGDDDYRFYAGLADRLDAGRVADIGCGTGVLATVLAQAGRHVVGIDPDPEMLRVARQRPGGGLVDWRLGTASDMDSESADLAVMSGHVSQVFLSAAQWHQTLQAIYRGLRPAGVIAFEMRNPGARAWERWHREQTLRTVETSEGPVEFWHETTDVDLPLVTYDTISRNRSTGDTRSSSDTLAFRDESALRADVRRAGFTVISLYGDWDASPVTTASPELILVAAKAGAGQ